MEEPSFNQALVSILIAMWITASVRLAFASNGRLKNFLADLLSIAAGVSAGGLTYWWL